MSYTNTNNKEESTFLSPDLNVSSFNSVPAFINEILKYNAIKTESCIPAIIKEYDRNTHKALAQPLVKRMVSMNDGIEEQEILPFEVHVQRLQCNNFSIDIPLSIGDTGWIIASDRDTTNVKNANKATPIDKSNPDSGPFASNKGPQAPNTYLLHKYSQGLFIPDRWGEITVEPLDEDSIFIMNKSGKKIRIDKDLNVHFCSDIFVDGTIHFRKMQEISYDSSIENPVMNTKEIEYTDNNTGIRMTKKLLSNDNISIKYEN